ncbi:MAG: serine--tRNA ligase, partial [Hyphomicrobium sp.]
MFDIKWIRDNPEAFDAGLAKRGLAPQSVELIALDEARRAVVTKLQEAQARRNAASKEIGKAKAAKDEATAQSLMAEVAALKEQLASGEDAERELDGKLREALSVIPNLPLDEVPLGKDEKDNVEVRKVGAPRNFDFAAKQHFEIGESLGLMDFATAAKISGARFVVLKGALARLERALGAFMLDLHTSEFGYTENIVPLLVKDDAAYGTGNLPKFAEDLFQTVNGFWLIPTAEVSLTNFVRDEILEDSALPMRLTAHTPCFRSEAGAAGKDTRGMIRQHQFSKVELVSITTPEESLAEHDRMTACAEEVLKR